VFTLGKRPQNPQHRCRKQYVVSCFRLPWRLKGTADDETAKDGPRTFGLMPVTEQPMMRPWRRTPRYHFGPMRLIFTSVKPAFLNHCTAQMQMSVSI